jgi:hypothetical protein
MLSHANDEGHVQNEYTLELPELSDDAILATDDAGEELLNFAVSWSGKTIRIRYPKFVHWERYTQDVYAILDAIGNGVEKVDIDKAQADKDIWADLCGRFIFLHDIYPRIRTAFFKYLRPTVDDMDAKQSRAWLTKNAPLDNVVRMFCALLAPQSMLKKNAIFAMTTIFQASQDRPSTPISTNSGAGQKSEPTEHQHSSSGFS